MKTHPDVNDTLRDEGLDAVRARSDRARKYRGPNGVDHDRDDARPRRLKLIPFNEIKLQTENRYLIKGLIPASGLTVVWGPPKCGKSFWVMDAMLHVTLNWQYRGRRVRHGPVVYCAMEGTSGYGARKEAFVHRHLEEAATHNVPFFLIPAPMKLVKDHKELVSEIKTALGNQKPVAIVLDTLNRSIEGSESSDEDMGSYVKAADALWSVFNCAVIIVHHCGVDEKRPRGHTSLTGAADAQLSVKRDTYGNISVTVEWMKDGPEGDTIVSRLDPVDVGSDEDGDIIKSCVVIPADAAQAHADAPRMSKNQQTMFSILHAAGPDGLTTDQWNEKARKVGLGTTRKADLYDFREALKNKKLVRQYGDRWNVTHS